MKFLGVTEASVSHDSLLAGMEAGFGRKIFRRVRRRSAWLSLVVLPRGLQRHQPGSFQFHPVFGERMLDRLVHADRAVENDAALGVGGRTRHRTMTEPDRFGGDQD